MATRWTGRPMLKRISYLIAIIITILTCTSLVLMNLDPYGSLQTKIVTRFELSVYKKAESNNNHTRKIFTPSEQLRTVSGVEATPIHKETRRKIYDRSSLLSSRKYFNISEVPNLVTLDYSNFTITRPNLVYKDDITCFESIKENFEAMSPPTSEQLRGEIHIVPNATFQTPYDCGYKSNVDFIRKKRKSNIHVDVLCPLVVPDGFAYQHFVDGVMPKLLQSYAILSIPSVKLLMLKPRNRIIYQFLEKLNISMDRVLWHEPGKVYSADYVVFTCNTPPLHPVLWEGMRSVIGVFTRMTPKEIKRVVLITREEGARNSGRRMINRLEVIKSLQQRYGERLLVLRTGFDDVDRAVEFYRNVSTIIAVHGGALYNMLFAPPDTKIVEIQPHWGKGRSGFNIFWVQAKLLGFKYWRIHENSTGIGVNFAVNVTKLLGVLDDVDRVD